LSDPTADAQGSRLDREEFLARIAALRPELHRYCARLTGSVFDGDDIVQNTLVRACNGFDELKDAHQLRPWLFRIAHNRALDHLRSKTRRMTEPLEAAADFADESIPDPVEALARQEAMVTAITRFVLLPTLPRSVVILKDVLDHSLADIAALLDISLAAVKSALHRGRTQLRELNAAAGPSEPPMKPPSAEIARYVSLFNARDWDPLRALLAEDVRLNQVSLAIRRGRADVGNFFTYYAVADDWSYLAPASVEGREVAAVFANANDQRPSYFMELVWQDGRILRIRDFRYARYVAENVPITLSRDKI
jgi:RNA polymerase sigma-70 factor, ECF subfamily